MRIISGKAGGITLSVPKGEVRPTTDRVREAVFSILNPLMDRADVLDLFAGSGAFGLEALSRGARDARMVDFSRLSCAAARANSTPVAPAPIRARWIGRSVAIASTWGQRWTNPSSGRTNNAWRRAPGIAD